jgi:hypothetical protein
MNKEKVIYYQQNSWLTGATGFNVSTAPALNNRSELLADKVDSAKCTEFINCCI